jgi:antirestriction protein ArdC
LTKTIKTVLKKVLDCFESQNLPKAITYSVFPAANMPSSNWSLLNRILIFLSDTHDARGFRQWKEVDRYVKKGAKAIHILVPRIMKKENDEGNEEERLAGFMARPVFRIEDTEGETVEYEKVELPNLPLMEKAKEWGISVKAIPGNPTYYGYFSSERKEIALASKEETVFFHELSHAAHKRLVGTNKNQQWKKEIVAELAAAVLCQIVGKTSKYLGNNYRYIEHYAKKASLNPVQGCLKVINDVEKVLGLILTKK